MDEPGEGRIERLLGGTLMLRQPAHGHRAGTDAVLLAASAAPHAGDVVVDVGSGVGAVGLAVARAEPAASVRLFERDPLMARYARDNTALNGLATQVSVEEADLFATDGSSLRAATLLLSNPPFYAADAVRASPNALKAAAHVVDAPRGAGPGAWLSAMLRPARPHARLIVIHRPEALGALLAAAEGRLGAIRVRPVYPRRDRAAIRILFGGIVASRAPLALVTPLLLHDDEGAFTELAEALHRAEAMLPLIDAPPTRKSRPRGPAH